MNFFPDFAPNSRKEWRLLLFQSNLRKQIRKLPKILKFVRIIHYYSKIFSGVLSPSRTLRHGPPSWRPPFSSSLWPASRSSRLYPLEPSYHRKNCHHHPPRTSSPLNHRSPWLRRSAWAEKRLGSRWWWIRFPFIHRSLFVLFFARWRFFFLSIFISL